jgi:hypothetical protein
VKDELVKWLPVGTDGRLQGVKEWSRFFFVAFGITCFLVMIGLDFQTVTVPGLGWKLNPKLDWWYFALASIFCGMVTQRLTVAQDERRAQGGTGGGTQPPSPPSDPPAGA